MRFYGQIAKNAGKKVVLPDPYIPNPSDSFVVCRDENNSPTAVYGWPYWDLNPYRLSARKINIIRFHFRGGEFDDDNYEDVLISQWRFCLYKLNYNDGSGKLGKISATVLVQYSHVIRKLAEYCAIKSKNSLASNITLFEILSNPTYLNAFLKRDESTLNEHKSLSAILNSLVSIPEQDLGFKCCSKTEVDLVRKEDNQHPVIPSRIYLEIINLVGEKTNKYLPHAKSINKLIKKMDDQFYGTAVSTQESQIGKGKLSSGAERYRPTMEEALKLHGLWNLYIEDNYIASRASFGTWIRNIQYVCKLGIHLYTGIRDQECGRMPYSCLNEHKITEPVEIAGDIVDEGRMIPLISTTTKFTGYKQVATWLAPYHVQEFVMLLQEIAEALASLHGDDLDDTYLFIKAAIIRTRKSEALPDTYINSGPKGEFTKIVDDRFRITEDDLEELKAIDPNRNFEIDETYDVGNIWPITSHQFRRSLAFYACNSGFVSLDTLSTQFKQTSRMMAQYYGRGAEHLLPVFTNLRSKSDRTNHVAFEFKISSPIAVVEQLYKDIFANDGSFFGSTGSHLQKQKEQVRSGEISIQKSKNETLKLVKEGRLSWRETPIGGCSGTGNCTSYLMGELTDCLTKECTVINMSKVDQQIKKLKSLLTRYEPDSHEYEIAKYDLDRLEHYRRNRMNAQDR